MAEDVVGASGPSLSGATPLDPDESVGLIPPINQKLDVAQQRWEMIEFHALREHAGILPFRIYQPSEM